MSRFYQKDTLTALEAVSEAQRIAFAPFLFQAAWALRELGILEQLFQASSQGLSAEELAEPLGLDPSGVSILLDMGLSGKLVWQEQEKYHLGRVGYFILNDTMSRINMDFTQNVCYQPMAHLVSSIRSGKPEGLRVYGDWDTIYPGLSSLPEPARSTWFKFDQYYSGQAFTEALPVVFAGAPSTIYDIGGNTGKWALCCINYDPAVRVKILDLPQQCELAEDTVREHQATGRISVVPHDVLTDRIPSGADVYWMSQFLDCFSKVDIVQILNSIREAMTREARIFILELFCDRQRYEAAAFSVNAISLYFTTLANGKSRFYRSGDLLDCIKCAGLEVVRMVDGLGFGHTLIECRVS